MIFMYLFLMPFLMFLFRGNEYHVYSVMFVWNILLFIPVVTLFSDKQWKHFNFVKYLQLFVLYLDTGTTLSKR